MGKRTTEKPTANIGIDAAPKAEWKALGGSDRDRWNEQLVTLVVGALPVDQKTETVSCAGSAVIAGVVDMKPADPIEGMLMSQLVVVNEAALNMYRLAWLNKNAGYFQASTRYLQLADKASRTVAVLTERLDQHRGRGQQQIVVKHVTVNADQALVTDTVVTGKPAGSVVPSPALLADATDKPMPTLDETGKLEPTGGTKSK